MFADDEDLHFPVECLPFQEILCLAAGGAVSNGDGFDLVGLYHLLQFGECFFALVHRRMRIDILIMQQIALCIQAYHLAAGTESRIYSHYPLLP